MLKRTRPHICQRLFLPRQSPSCLITTAVVQTQPAVPPLSAFCGGERKSYLLRCGRGYGSTRWSLRAQRKKRKKKDVSQCCVYLSGSGAKQRHVLFSGTTLQRQRVQADLFAGERNRCQSVYNADTDE